MKLHSEHITRQTGLQLDKQSGVFFGKIQQFSVFLSQNPRQNSARLRITGRLENPEEANRQLQEWQAQYPCIMHAFYRDRRIECVLMLPKKQTDDTICSLVAAASAKAADLGMMPCCMACGSKEDFSDYLLDSSGIVVCEECRTQLNADLAGQLKKQSEIRPSYPGLFIGAVLGALLVFLMTWFVLLQSRLTVLTSYAGMMLGFFLMKKYGKRITATAVMLCAVFSLLGSGAGIYLHYAQAFAEKNRELADSAQQRLDMCNALEQQMADLSESERSEYDFQSVFGENSLEETRYTAELIIECQTTGACFFRLWDLIYLTEGTALRQEVISCFVWSVISILAGTALCGYPLLRETRRNTTLRKPVAA